MECLNKKVREVKNRGKRPPISSKWRVGDLIRDRYEVYDIRAGGIGIVYIVFDHEDGIPYAIKTPQDWLLGDSVVKERFIREAEVWIRLGLHQNIVRAFFVDRIDNQPFIFLEYIIGSNLRKALSKGPLPKRTILSYAVQFCRGMVHAQQKIPGFAHLDIKPENCMLTQENTLKVTDFSLSKLLFDSNPSFGSNSQNGIQPSKKAKVIGTFPYMAPEQFIDLGRASIQSDIYSFGIMLYEMLTGKRPFYTEIASQWRDVHLKVKPKEPRSIVPSVSKGLNDLIMSCLAKNPHERPENFMIIMNSIEAALREEFHEEIPRSTPEELESWEYSNKGVSLCNLGHPREAITCFDQALSTTPGNSYARLNKGVALGMLGYVEEELECYEEALGITPEYAEAWYNKGLALYKLRRFDEAINCYDRALTINPYQAEVWVNKGLVMGSFGRFEEELSCYEKALAINPGHGKAWVNKASALINLDRFEEADACCDRALQTNPGMAEAWANKATALGALKRYDETIRCCEKALAIDPQLCDAWVSKALALGSLGRFEEELSCYQEALAINPRHAGAWLNKGMALRNLGLRAEADQCVQRAISIDPILSQVIK